MGDWAFSWGSCGSSASYDDRVGKVFPPYRGGGTGEPGRASLAESVTAIQNGDLTPSKVKFLDFPYISSIIGVGEYSTIYIDLYKTGNVNLCPNGRRTCQ